MEIRIKTKGVEYEATETTRSIRIILSTGEEFELSESFEALVVNKTDGSINIKPEYSNQVSLK